MKSLIRIGSVPGLVLGLSACGTLYQLDVTAYNNPNHELDKTYVVLSGSSDLSVNSPEFDEYANQLQRALATKGYRRVASDNIGSAALGVYVSADISDPGKKYHTVTSGIYETPYAEDSGAATKANSGGQQSNPNLPQQAPAAVPEVLTGYESTGFATTVFTKHLNLVAVDLQQYLSDIAAVGRSKAVPTEIWSIDIETTGQPDDLRDVFPVMIAAAQPYLADSTKKVVQVKISETDKRVNAIKGSK